mmetsp:Transcript_41596/g.120587  ORF Transcript_41596/g.120587 Transcript_41596/m.120587 type:complete len:212 (+) Transcript_41596:446-1081(+)
MTSHNFRRAGNNDVKRTRTAWMGSLNTNSGCCHGISSEVRCPLQFPGSPTQDSEVMSLLRNHLELVSNCSQSGGDCSHRSTSLRGTCASFRCSCLASSCSRFKAAAFREAELCASTKNTSDPVPVAWLDGAAGDPSPTAALGPPASWRSIVRKDGPERGPRRPATGGAAATCASSPSVGAWRASCEAAAQAASRRMSRAQLLRAPLFRRGC